jgi:REase_AHJR-like
MNIEPRLNILADRYQTRGFKVVLRPRPDDLPPFAKDFKVEILATGPETNVLASVKATAEELEADPNILRYSEIIEKQPGWRFDLFVLGPEQGLPKKEPPPSEPSEDDIRQALDEVERMLQAGFVTSAFAAAWSALEAAMRRRVRAGGRKTGWGDDARTMLDELYSSGFMLTAVLRELERLLQVRRAIIHGFSAPAVDAVAVRFLVDTGRRLLAESQPVKQPA